MRSRCAAFALAALSNVALLAALVAALGSISTYVPHVERGALWQMVAFGSAAAVIELALWRWLPFAGRVFAAGTLAIAAFAVCMATTRLA